MRLVSGPITATKVLIGVCAALLLLLGVQTCRVRSAEGAQAKAALDAYNERVQHTRDTTLVGQQLAALRKTYGDSVAGVTRLAVQQQQQNDRLDQALQQNRIALEQVTATVKVLQAKASSSGAIVEDTAGVRSGSFDIRQVPYTAHADVDLPKPPAKGAMDLRVTLDPAVMNLRLGCGAVDANGIREARATAEGPSWLALSIDRVEQDPGVCPSPALQKAQSSGSHFRPQLSIGPGYGLQRAPDGTVRAGFTLDVQLSLFHWP
jgi:hypothetical protein